MAAIGDRGTKESCDCFIPLWTPSQGCFSYALLSWDPIAGLKGCFWPEPGYHQVEEEESTPNKVFDCWCCVFGKEPRSDAPTGEGANSSIHSNQKV